MKKLYINGCSFTAGNNLKDNMVFSSVMSEITKLKCIDQAKNGNSMKTICFTSMNHLCDMSPEDTIVIIGLTWPTRYMVQFGDGCFNITPPDLDRNNNLYTEKFSTWRRLSSPHSISDDYIIDIHDYIEKNNDKFSSVMSSYTDYFKSLVEHDEFLEKNQQYEFIYNLLSIQSFLKQFGFKYKFIQYQHDYQLYSTVSKNVIDKIDFDNVIKMNFDKKYIDDLTSHPSEEGVLYLSRVVYEHLKSYL